MRGLMKVKFIADCKGRYLNSCW